METKTVRIEIKLTRAAIAVLLGTVLLVAGLLIAGGALAQSPEPQSGTLEADEAMKGTDYDPSLQPRLPREMNYQGVLRDEDGELVDGTHDLTFKMYRYAMVGLMKWRWVAVYTETQTSIPVNQGLFNVKIGTEEPLDLSVFEGDNPPFVWDLQLGVSVDGGDELTPRADLLPVPYAFRAEYVNRFPRPHYDSGWEVLGTRPDFVNVVFQHNLAGNPGNYVVDLQCKHATLGAYQCLDDDAYWHHLTDTEITVWATSNPDVEQIRVRIWRIE
ncbi:MAG: hypothetical protein U9R72_13705 [Chloroflexota bacterium]|nr:hypothetical protein [Chloroflexota bacterium]